MSRHSVNVIPRSRQNGVIERHGELTVRVSVPAEDGKANEAVRSVLAEYWNISKSRVILFRGKRSRKKIIEKLDEVELLE